MSRNKPTSESDSLSLSVAVLSPPGPQLHLKPWCKQETPKQMGLNLWFPAAAACSLQPPCLGEPASAWSRFQALGMGHTCPPPCWKLNINTRVAFEQSPARALCQTFPSQPAPSLSSPSSHRNSPCSRCKRKRRRRWLDKSLQQWGLWLGNRAAASKFSLSPGRALGSGLGAAEVLLLVNDKPRLQQPFLKPPPSFLHPWKGSGMGERWRCARAASSLGISTILLCAFRPFCPKTECLGLLFAGKPKQAKNKPGRSEMKATSREEEEEGLRVGSAWQAQHIPAGWVRPPGATMGPSLLAGTLWPCRWLRDSWLRCLSTGIVPQQPPATRREWLPKYLRAALSN